MPSHASLKTFFLYTEVFAWVAVSVCTFSGWLKTHLMHHCNCLAFKRYNITISGSGFYLDPLVQSFLSRNNLEFLSSEGIHRLFLKYICLFTFLTPSSVVGSYHLMTTDSGCKWCHQCKMVSIPSKGIFDLRERVEICTALFCVRGHNIICTQQDLSGLLPGCF